MVKLSEFPKIAEALSHLLVKKKKKKPWRNETNKQQMFRLLKRQLTAK